MESDKFQTFKYKAALVEKTANANDKNSIVKSTKIVIQLNYLNNFWRLLEMSLINYKIHLDLNWIEDCILLYSGNFAKFKITDAKLHGPVVTWSTKGNRNLAKQLPKGFKRSFC